jgi:phage terminase large subunit-like protein
MDADKALYQGKARYVSAWPDWIAVSIESREDFDRIDLPERQEAWSLNSDRKAEGRECFKMLRRDGVTMRFSLIETRPVEAGEAVL